MNRPGLLARIAALEAEVSSLQARSAASESARLAQETALRESEERFRVLADLSPVAILVNQGGRYVYANRAAADVLRAESPEQLLGGNPLDLAPPDTHSFRATRTEGILVGGGNVPLAQMQWRCLDGVERTMESAAGLVQWEGSPAIQVVIRDISEAKHTEYELRATAERLQFTLSAAKMGDWELDLRSQESPRRSFRHDQVFGYSEPQVDWSYQRFLEHVIPEDRPHADALFRNALESCVPWDFECRIRLRTDGEIRWIWGCGGPQCDSEGQPERMFGLVTDITHRKVATEERDRLLRESEEARATADAARMEAVNANRAKSDFLASMSHELRTPLNAIGGYVDLLELGIHGPITDDQGTALRRILANQQHLLMLINEVLTFAKLEAGQLSFNLQTLSVDGVLSEIESFIAPQAGAKGIAYSVREAVESGLMLEGDEEKVRQILLNLVGNAIKFTPPGGWVSLSCHADESAVYLHVQDNGPGIAVEKQRFIFDPFIQVERRHNNPQEGVGLGLAISRDLARSMGGELSVVSAVGAGATFTLRLPRLHPLSLMQSA